MFLKRWLLILKNWHTNKPKKLMICSFKELISVSFSHAIDLFDGLVTNWCFKLLVMIFVRDRTSSQDPIWFEGYSYSSRIQNNVGFNFFQRPSS